MTDIAAGEGGTCDESGEGLGSGVCQDSGVALSVCLCVL